MAGTPNKPNNNETLKSLETLSDEELVALKSQAIANEDYDKAKEIKKEQERRKESKETEVRKIVESANKKEDLKGILDDDKKFQEIKEMAAGFAKLFKNLIESNDDLGVKNKMSSDKIEETMDSFLYKMNNIMETYSDSNYKMASRMADLKDSIDKLAQKLENNNHY